MTESALLPILENIKKSNVLVIGDIMLDRFVYGHVERISPESPVPILAIKREEKMLGGAGNALANLAGLEATGTIISLVGDDEEAADIKSQIETLGFSASGLIKTARPTIVKTRFLAGHQQLLRTDFEKTGGIDNAIAEKIKAAVTSAITTANAVIISDYGKGMLRQDVIAHIIERAKSQNIPVIVDPKGQDFSIYRGASVLTPNKKELSEATKGHAVSTDEDVIAAAQILLDECGIDAVIATRSGDGISVIQTNAAPTHIHSPDIEVFDVSGAGDTVIATIAASLAAGANLPQAANLANIAGSIVVTKVGTASIRTAELADALQNDTFNLQTTERPKADRTRAGDILESEAAAETIRRWKARGLKVGFTNGCFDILHFGHVSYLNNARDHCDRLIIGLNTDASVRVLKGPDRPVHDEISRAGVLAALGSVDMVVLFGAETARDDNTATALLKTLQPDIYFKGGDYQIDQIPEAPTVQSYNGEVKIMPVYDGHSTTGSIKKINSDAA